MQEAYFFKAGQMQERKNTVAFFSFKISFPFFVRFNGLNVVSFFRNRVGFGVSMSGMILRGRRG